MHELMDWLLGELNGLPDDEYIIRRNNVKGDWYLESIDIPVDDDIPLEATWTTSMTAALKFHSVEHVHDFAIAHLVPRPCTIIKMET